MFQYAHYYYTKVIIKGRNPFSITFMEAHETNIPITLMPNVFPTTSPSLPLLITGEVPLKIPNYQTMGWGSGGGGVPRPSPSPRQGDPADPPCLASIIIFRFLSPLWRDGRGKGWARRWVTAGRPSRRWEDPPHPAGLLQGVPRISHSDDAECRGMMAGVT